MFSNIFHSALSTPSPGLSHCNTRSQMVLAPKTSPAHVLFLQLPRRKGRTSPTVVSRQNARWPSPLQLWALVGSIADQHGCCEVITRCSVDITAVVGHCKSSPLQAVSY